MSDKLASVRLRNFQRHKDLTIDLSPGITTIIGATDSGKSSIVRALRWAMLNEAPRNLVRRGQKKVGVTLTTQSGRKVRRARLGTSNEYRVDSKPFVAFKTDVPTPVQEVLKVSEMNFSTQFDAPFWFAASAPEVSRRLNKLVNLSLLDTVLSNIAARVRKEKLTVEIVRERRLEAIAERDQTQNAPAIFKEVEQLVEMLGKRTRLIGQIEELDRLINLVRELKQEERELPDLEKLDADVRKLGEMRKQLFRLTDQINTCREAAQEIRIYDDKLNGKEIEFHKLNKGKCPLCQSPLNQNW